ncbi:MAG: endolytic transglycosylase MltG [Gemmatimonadales bacterium]|nr:endolytic transglycosylase MltG [Gemmatimonadales bacterium]
MSRGGPPRGPVALVATVALLAGCAGSGDGVERVRIPAGASMRAVAESLAAHGLGGPTGAIGLRVAARLQGLDRKLRAGVYDIPRALGPSDVVALLARGESERVQVTVPEGLMAPEVAAIAARALGVPADSFLAAVGDSLEGYLYPETYSLDAGASARDLVAAMRAQFARAWRPGWDARLDTLGLSRAQLVALASIVEGEAASDAERATIAGVYWNRLRHGMPLQADPTVQYAILQATGARKPRLLYSDYRIPSPYNTYLRAGLPPGPVNSPGARSLEAALYPASHPYHFFVLGLDGRHVFTRDYREHLRAVAAIRRGR